MKLEQSFTVAAPLAQVWSALVDIERVAPCLPGAEITGNDGEGGYSGNFTVKLGPTTAAYSGVLEMQSVDESTRTATMTARGTDKRGQGGATATIVSSAREVGGETAVDVVTDLTITGRLARFGRSGMIEDISNRLLRDFAECLQATVGAAEPAAARGVAAAPARDDSAEPGEAGEAGEPAAPVAAGEVPAEAAGGAAPSADRDRVGTMGVPPPSPPGGQPPGMTGDADVAAERTGSPGESPPAADDVPADRGAATPAPPPDAASPAPPPPSGGPGGEVGTAGGGGAPPPPATGPPSPPGGRARHEEPAAPPSEAEAVAAQAEPAGDSTQAPVAEEPPVRTESIPPPGHESPTGGSSARPAAKPVKGLSLLGSVLLGRIRRLFSRGR